MSDTFLQHSFLAHHGILGMKWGVRRYQNKDGSFYNDGVDLDGFANQFRFGAQEGYNLDSFVDACSDVKKKKKT